MRKLIKFIVPAILAFSMIACSGTSAETVSINQQDQNSSVAAAAASVPTTDAATVTEVLAENSTVHDDAEDYVWDSASEVPIVLNGDSISVDGAGVTVEGSTVTITSAGTYSLSGSLEDGQIIVNTTDEETVRLILNGVDLQSSTSAPIYVIEADEVVLILADNSVNTVSDGANYTLDDTLEDAPNAAIFSMADLTIYGNGSLIVNGNSYDGIASKDGLVIASGTITVNAADDGMRGKDYLVIKDGNISITSQGDGLKSDNEDDATKGYISIENGVIHIKSGGDAMDAVTDVMILDGEFTLNVAGGISGLVDGTTSLKGIAGGVSVNIDGGTFNINSPDDAIHSNGSLVINGGTFTIASGDDGMHADASLVINGGDIQIAESYEGIESAVITIGAGNIHVVASDDGINVAGGNDGSGMNPGGRPGQGGGPGQDSFTYTGDYYLYINGGTILVDAAGDGIDVNGAIEMTGGIVVVNGPTEQMNGALDYDASVNQSGGTIVAAGSSGMAQAPSGSSSQNSVLINFTATQPAGTLVHIQNSQGEDLLTFAPTKNFQSFAFSSPELATGETYAVYLGGSSTGTQIDGTYQDGSYTPGEQYTSFTISSVSTMIGTARRNRP